MSQPLRSASSYAQEDAAKIAQILVEVGEPAPYIPSHATAGGDERKLRGIPAIGRGVAGAVPGTNPLAELMARAPRD